MICNYKRMKVPRESAISLRNKRLQPIVPEHGCPHLTEGETRYENNLYSYSDSDHVHFCTKPASKRQ